MTKLAILLLMQYVISTKAGLVNHTQGNVNIRTGQSVASGESVKTGTDGYAEILLNPGSFLRVGESSEVVFDSVDLYDIRMRLLVGSAVIEAGELDKDNRIRVTTQNLTTDIRDRGLYVFSEGKASVLSGKLRPAHSKDAVKKGWLLAANGSIYEKTKIPKKPVLTTVEIWSRGRAELIAQANQNAYQTLRRTRSYDLWGVWLFNPFIGYYTYMPRYDYRSPYGVRYYSVAPVYNSPSYESASGGGYSAPARSGGASESGSSGGFGGSSGAGNTSGAAGTSGSAGAEGRSAPAGMHVP